MSSRIRIPVAVRAAHDARTPGGEIHHTFCRICESLCGLEVTVEDGVISQIRPDHDHVATGGFACIKGTSQHKLYASPDRLTHPMKRVGEEWSQVSWDVANKAIGEKIRQIVKDHGPDSVGMYVGTAAGFSVLHPVFAQGFMDAIGSKSLYASATQDCSNKFAAAREIYGFPFTQPFPDVEHTNCLIIVGANPVVSKWSFLQVVDPTKRLREVAERGGRVFVIDPRFTETARAATDHVFIRPDTDVFFYLAFLHEVIRRGAVKRDIVADHTIGFEKLESLANEWSPERVAEATHMSAEVLRSIVDAYLNADGAALYCSTGVNMGTNGVLAWWVQEAINLVTGNLDRAGGTLVGKGVIDFARFGARTGVLLSDDTSRIGGFRKVNDAHPGGVLADEILTPGPKQLRALIVTGGNPLITMADAGKLRDAFGQLELLVTVDIYRNETGSLAHYTLPATDPFQRPDLPFIFPLMLGLQSKPYLQATLPVIAPTGEQRDEATIYVDLCRAAGGGLFGSKIAQKLLELSAKRHSAKLPDGRRALPQQALLNLLLRLCRQPSFKTLLSHKHGWMRKPHKPGTFLGTNRVVTKTEKVQLSTDRLLERAERLEVDFAKSVSERDELKLISKRHVKTHNSWTHNHESMIRNGSGDGDTNHLWMHSIDAAARGLRSGDIVDVRTATATVRIPIKLLDDLMPGTCAMEHGWGHQHATGMQVASKTRGVNVNLLSASGPVSIDPLSNMSHLTGLTIDVSAAAGPRDETDWSGIAATGPSPTNR